MRRTKIVSKRRRIMREIRLRVNNFKKLKNEVIEWLEDAEKCYFKIGLGRPDCADSLTIASRKIQEFKDEI